MAQARGITMPQDILDLQKVPAAGRLNWVACMTQVMATAAPYDGQERNELLGLMLDEAKVVG